MEISLEPGEEKVTLIVQKIATSGPTYRTYGQIETRLAAGEFPLATFFHSSGISRLKSEGAPVEFVNVAPIPVSLQMSAVVKGALHPNAAMLFAAFSVTPEGQEIWQKYGARSSGFIAGTPEWKSRGPHSRAIGALRVTHWQGRIDDAGPGFELGNPEGTDPAPVPLAGSG